MRNSLLLALALAATFLPTNAFVPSSHVTVSTTTRSKVAAQHPTAICLPKAFSPVSSSKTALALSGAEAVADGSLTNYMTKLLLETLIVNGVPAFFTLLVIGFAAFQFRPRKDKGDDYDMKGPDGKQKKNPAAELYSDLYEGEESDKPMSPFAFFKMFKPPATPASTNRGIPALQYIKITNLNQKYDSYDYSLTAATESKAKAAAAYRTKNFDRALRLGLNSGNYNSTFSPFAKTTLLELEKEFLKEGSKLLNVIQTSQTELTKTAIENEMEALGMKAFDLDPPTNATTMINKTSDIRPNKNIKSIKKSSSTDSKLMAQLAKAQKDLIQLELDFVMDVVATLGSERASGIQTALLGDIAARGTGGLLTQIQDRPLTVLLNNGATTHYADSTTTELVDNGDRRKSVFVTRFPGDPSASQVAGLREEVTAIVRSAKPGDEALVVLQTGGGTVTGYGLAAAQLLRFKDAGMKLTIAVEQVAASGGYMMACVADKIVSSPFAVLGSIGVISDIPNVYERLKKEGIEFQTVTAGKYKRTITPTKKVTPLDFEKTKQDVEQILVLFKQFVHQNRPSLDIDEVATGETWFGEDALERGLTDEIKTPDEVLMEFVDSGCDVYEVEYNPPDKALALAGVPGTQVNDANGGAIRNAIRWLARTMVREVKAELGTDFDPNQLSAAEKRYMMIDNSADRVRSK